MKNRRKSKKINLLLLVILGLTVGFALLSTTLKINGTAGIKSNTWNIHWVKNSIIEDTGSVTATTAADTTDSANQVIEFAAEFEFPGDYYEFTVDAINEGSIDGIIADEADIKKGIYNLSDQLVTTIPENFIYTVVYADDDDDPTNDVAPSVGDILKAGETKKYKVRVEFDSEIEELPETAESYKFKFEVTYTQYKESAPTTKKFAVQGDNPEIAVKREVCADSECFYIIDTNATTTTLLAKYNIFVGANAYESPEKYPYGLIEENNPLFGLQNADAQGSIETASNVIAVVPFAANDYWYAEDGSTGNIVYSSDYLDGYIYDDDYDTAPNWTANGTNDYSLNRDNNMNYSVAYYVKKYGDILLSKNISFNKIRILNQTEAEYIINNFDDMPKTNSWIGAEDLSQGSPCYLVTEKSSYYDNKYYIGCTSMFENANTAGVRPVIEVPTSALVIE